MQEAADVANYLMRLSTTSGVEIVRTPGELGRSVVEVCFELWNRSHSLSRNSRGRRYQGELEGRSWTVFVTDE